jgi:hypothetical protein
MMIFASDRNGSLGGFDLFISRKEGEAWSAPENIGRLINTKSDELHPFLDNSDNLYFSSCGHPGYGGYDIFVSRLTEKDGKNRQILRNLLIHRTMMLPLLCPDRMVKQDSIVQLTM